MGRTSHRTVVIRGRRKVAAVAANALQRARRSILMVTEQDGPSQLVRSKTARDFLGRITSKGVEISYVTEITRRNSRFCQTLSDELKVQVRHLDGVKGSFLVTDRKEFLATYSATARGQQGPEIIYSDIPQNAQRNVYLFEMLWEIAIPSEIRISALQTGTELGETKLTYSTDEIFDSADRFLNKMEKEALVITPREGGVAANPEFFRSLVRRGARVGATIKIFGRFSHEDEIILAEARSSLGGRFSVRRLETNNALDFALGIYDRRGMGLVQYVYPGGRPEERSGERSYLSGVISTDTAMIAGIASLFDSLWEESELRERETQERRTAELLQDILTHDIRNYIQIAKSNVELLKEGQGPADTVKMLEAIDRAADKTTELIENAKKLAKIVGQAAELHPVDIRASVLRSLGTVEDANPRKRITAIYSPPSLVTEPRAEALADDLLDEVFTNVISNSVKYTEGNDVSLEVTLKEESTTVDPASPGFWRVSIADHGRGIGNEAKHRVFTRYQKSAGGTGLGLSIVHALVVGRYGGNVKVGDSTPGEPLKGAKVEIMLQRARP